ncbi:DUF1003 domain-containing protein [Desertibaculum subflavum]|uniref:DUF1003 domain-containing protein n=1 Tax=Desertibaculum subflavum TaxID=2268458 RepID=UPI000E673E6E
MPDAARPANHLVCQICGRAKRRSELVAASLIRPTLAAKIAEAVPGWSAEGYICTADLNLFRQRYVETLLEAELGETASLERSVIERIARQETLASDVDREIEQDRSTGEWLADRVAAFGGSWRFLILFTVVMIAWMGLNSWALARGAFDPYPYILLNLVLSCLAAIQAPIIMMSQNRQEARDRRHARNDYLVNLKAELEIRLLHEKLDHLLQHQWERLLEIQQIQIELMNEVAGRRPRG